MERLLAPVQSLASSRISGEARAFVVNPAISGKGCLALSLLVDSPKGRLAEKLREHAGAKLPERTGFQVQVYLDEASLRELELLVAEALAGRKVSLRAQFETYLAALPERLGSEVERVQAKVRELAPK